MTEDEIAVKFNALGESVIGLDACNELRTLVMNMENEETLARMFELMTAKETASC
jgi:hypothetical protein